jgi:dipeptidyl aminopeptidase/acylaminoacyl peptidase
LSPRFIKVTVTLLVVLALSAALYFVSKTDNVHPRIDTAGKLIYLSDAGSAGKAHIWIVNQDGTGAKDLTPGTQTCADPAFSPDGSQIAYVSDKAGQGQVYIMNADGNNAQRITFGSASKAQPEFAPDGKTLAFISQGELTEINLDTRQPQILLPPASKVAAGAEDDSMLPNETPDAFMKRRLLASPVIKFSWAPVLTTGSNHEPSIAAVQECDDQNIEGVTMLPTLEGTPVTLPLAPTVSIGWAPNGTKLETAIIGAKIGSRPFSGIISISPAGMPIPQQPLALVLSGTVGPYDPRVSPDGTKVAFSVLSAPDLAHQEIKGLFTQSMDGSTSPKQAILGPVTNVLWSPDGSDIMFIGPRSGKHDLWVASTTKTAPAVDLTNGTGDVTKAEWSPSLAKAK